jgi:superfamily II DNA helicase RecQ
MTISMHFFVIPALDPTEAQQELNAFLSTRRIVAIDRQLVQSGAASTWVICVQTTHHERRSDNATNGRAPRIDYREILSPSDFELFARLRIWRKETAEREGIPSYGVFTNEQLAKIATERCSTSEALSNIHNVGPSRVQKYGAAVIELVATSPLVAELDDQRHTQTPAVDESGHG